MILAVLHCILYTASALAALTVAGNAVCRFILSWSGATLPSASEDQGIGQAAAIKAGRLIGTLERLLVACGILASSWEVLVAVIALKTAARFKELDDRIQAEYFLIGSLFSLLWTLLVTNAWIYYDQEFGIGLLDLLTESGR